MTANATAGPVRRLALLLEYDGGRYGGSQYQKNAPSIQGELEAAITRLTGERVRVAFAGRTDAGVHATGQVAAFSTASRHPPQTFVGGLNYWLPADVAVRAAVETAPEFDPRRHARSRTYRYLLLDRRPRSPMWQGRAWEIERPLDGAAMAEAAAALVGEHDFAAFAGRLGRANASTRRRLHRCQVARRGPLVCVEMEADAFLPHQVRRTVGFLADIGMGHRAPAAVSQHLDDPARRPVTQTAPACGLYLVRVRYDDLDFGVEDGEDWLRVSK